MSLGIEMVEIAALAYILGLFIAAEKLAKMAKT